MDMLPIPKELKKALPLNEEGKLFVAKARNTIQSILEQKDSRKLFIVGPCSIHDPGAAIEYAEKIIALQKDVEDTIFIVMRSYIEKPRTHLGWKGLIYDPDLNGSHNMQEGIRVARSLFLKLTELQIPIASEILDPFASEYFDDLVSWGCIGARTTESQTHRLMASGLKFPVAFKNSTDGNIKIAINGIITASAPHTFVSIDDSGRLALKKTQGNPFCHLVLRGGSHHTNYDHISIAQANKDLKEHHLLERVIVDCSHGNSKGSPDGQISAFKSVIAQMLEGNETILGIILESHLFGGRQEITNTALRYGVSVTDHCLDFETTEQLIRWAYEYLKSVRETADCVALSTQDSNYMAHETIHP